MSNSKCVVYMTRNFMTKGPTLIVSWKFITQQLSSIPRGKEKSWYYWRWLRVWNSCDMTEVDRKVERVLTWWLTTQDMDWYQQSIEKLVPEYNRCLIWDGNYLGKYWDSGMTKSELFILGLKLKNPKYLQCKIILWPAFIFSHLFVTYMFCCGVPSLQV
jgi:hypothetical protein